MEVLVFNPIYQERVWGGRGLEHRLGRKLPAEQVIGESWEIVDRPEADSVSARGDTQGKSLSELRETETAALLGPDWDAAKPFPILVKWLDCQDRLSLQVHPPAEIAGELGGEPKTENWYIAEASEGAAVLAGLQPGVTPEQFAEALKGENGELEALVPRLPTRAGDSLFVHSGRIHAIDAGNLILEIQQNSDTTYRVYDWGRVGLDGKPRQLHIEQSLRSIDFDDAAPSLVRTEGADVTLADSDVFRLRRLTLESGAQLSFEADEQPRIISIVSGSLELGDGSQFSRGDNVLIPYTASFDAKATGETIVLVTENFI
jgi:mannose-6-phosphate isomerase